MFGNLSFYQNADDLSTVFFYVERDGEEYETEVTLTDAIEYAVHKPTLYFHPYSRGMNSRPGSAYIFDVEYEMPDGFDTIAVPSSQYANTLPEFVDRARREYIDHLRGVADRLEKIRVI